MLPVTVISCRHDVIYGQAREFNARGYETYIIWDNAEYGWLYRWPR